jgi:hypothetical protein
MLQEEKNQIAQDIAIAFIGEMIDEHYASLFEDQEYQATEEDYAAFEAVVEHFVENYKHPTIFEAAWESHTGNNINQELFDEMYETLLDEGLGKFVAGAVHGIRNYFSGRKAEKTQQNLNKAKEKYAANKKVASSRGGGFMGAAKRGYAKSRERTLGKNIGKKTAAANVAQSAHAENKRKTTNLARRIDRKVSNVGSKIGGAVGSFVSKFKKS